MNFSSKKILVMSYALAIACSVDVANENSQTDQPVINSEMNKIVPANVSNATSNVRVSPGVQGNHTPSETPSVGSNVVKPEFGKDIFDLPVLSSPEKKFPDAIEVAQSALQTDVDLKPRQRDFVNYTTTVRHDRQFLYILYGPKIRNVSGPDGSGETDVARDLYFIVRKSDNKLMARLFMK